MLPESRDPALIWDMRQACADIVDFVKDVNFEQFQHSKVIRYAVERQILVIGEAARQVSENFKNKNPQIPWKTIIGQRNILAHEYGQILVERIWLVAVEHIPKLLNQLDGLLPSEQ